ncbi:MAG: branched-chain amino acid ABC transporter permease [Chloroflexi bacterium]|nr:MAG: branched-chain amino acid ABC transporter permease [Chloroflexota bacterium]
MATADVSVTDNRDTTTSSGYKSRKYILGVIVAALALVPVLQWQTTNNLNFWLNLLIIIFLWITMSTSWNIIGGYAGYISLGHNVFAAIGGYLAAMLLLRLDIPVFVTAPFAGLVAMVVGFVIGLITLRVRGPAFIISTIALVLVLRTIIDNWDFLGGVRGLTLPLIGLDVQLVKIPFYYAMLLVALLSIYFSYWIRHSKFGLGLRAISQDEIKAETAGIPTKMYKVLAYAASAFFIGVAGALWSQYVTFVDPGTYLIILFGARPVLMTLLGGKGTVAGPVVGAALVILATEFSESQFGGTELNVIGVGVVMIIVLLFFPDGLVGSLRRAGRLPALLDWD